MKQRISIVLLALSAIIVAGCGNNLESGIELLYSGNADGAIEKLSKIKDNSKDYSSARYTMHSAYLKKGDKGNAAAAIVEAVKSGNWEDSNAYETYADYLMTGSMEPYIKQNRVAAANLYSKNPDKILDAAKIYFDAKLYDRAYDIFSQYNTPEANGYLGIMHLYGLNGMDCDAAKAKNYIDKAPLVQPFLSHKADLMLFFDLYTTYHISGKTMDDALDYYEIALSQTPDDEVLMTKVNVLRNVLGSGTSRTESYTFTTDGGINGVYTGEIKLTGWTRSAHGWGCFAYSDHSFAMGKFNMLKLNGPGFKVDQWHYTEQNEIFYKIYVGRFVNDVLKEGFFIDNNGDVKTYK